MSGFLFLVNLNVLEGKNRDSITTPKYARNLLNNQIKILQFLLYAKKFGYRQDFATFVTSKPLLCHCTTRIIDGKCLFKPSISIKKSRRIYIFPESGSNKHFQASKMHVIDFSHQITSNRVFFVKINFE